MWQRVWRFLFLTYVRPVFKWILRMVTGKCELQRILASTERGAKRTLSIGKSACFGLQIVYTFRLCDYEGSNNVYLRFFD